MIASGKPQNFTVRVKRQDGPDKPVYYNEFSLAYKPNLNIISVLNMIAASPTTTAGQHVTPVAWEAMCLEEVCGACTMVINGRARQSCSALVDRLLEDSDVITLEPMVKFPVIRDLVVNRQRMFDNLIKVKAWVPIDGTHSLGAGPQETPENQDTRYRLSECMTCGCCLDACPQFEKDNNFVGAQVLSQVRYFNMHKTGATLADQRLDAVMGPGGITDCGNAQNCVKVCPKDIPLTESIAAIGRETTVHAIKKFFSGK